jgi:serralysin
VIWGGKEDDIMYGDAGADIFHFAYDDDDDVIADFTLGIDRIRIDLFYVNNFAQLMAYAKRDGSDTVFDFADSDTLRVENVLPGQFISSDFIIL